MKVPHTSFSPPSGGSTAHDIVVDARSISREFTIGENTITALQSCDIDVRAGEMLAIVGKSGSGKKSTLCERTFGRRSSDGRNGEVAWTRAGHTE